MCCCDSKCCNCNIENAIDLFSIVMNSCGASENLIEDRDKLDKLLDWCINATNRLYDEVVPCDCDLCDCLDDCDCKCDCDCDLDFDDDELNEEDEIDNEKDPD